METTETPPVGSSIVTGHAYLALPSAPTTWIVEGLVPSGGSMLLYGDPKAGKSYAALQLALAIHTGTPWLGFSVDHPATVVYVQLDTPRSLWQKRLRDLTASGEDISPVFQADRETLTYPFDILQPDHFNMLRAGLCQVKPEVVVIDTIRHAHDLDENDSTTMKRVYAGLVSATQPAALIIVAHSRKPGEGGSDVINDNRGSNFLVSAVDAIVKLSRKTYTNGGTIGYSGRAIEESILKIHQRANYFWDSGTDETSNQIEAILGDPSLKTQADQIAELSVRAGITLVAAKKRLQRHLLTPAPPEP